MGNCITSDFIMRAGSAIMDEFFSRGTLGQMITAIQAPTKCDTPNGNDNVKEFMRCQFLKGQREAWEFVLILFVMQSILMVILMYIIYIKSRKVVNNFRMNAENRIVNLKMLTAEQNSSSVRPTSTSRPRSANRQSQETAVNFDDAWSA